MAPASAEGACRNHPDRDAQGVCVTCRTPLCGECSTKVAGINQCVACLTAAARRDADPRDLRAESDDGVGGVLVWALLVVALTWGLIELALGGTA